MVGCIMGIYLDRDFRNKLFSLAYINCGKSLGSLAKEVGYHGKGRNGYVRNMWKGTTPVSSPKIQRIAELAEISMSEVLKHKVEKECHVEIDDWGIAFQSYATKLRTHGTRSSSKRVRSAHVEDTDQ